MFERSVSTKKSSRKWRVCFFWTCTIMYKSTSIYLHVYMYMYLQTLSQNYFAPQDLPSISKLRGIHRSIFHRKSGQRIFRFWRVALGKVIGMKSSCYCMQYVDKVGGGGNGDDCRILQDGSRNRMELEDMLLYSLHMSRHTHAYIYIRYVYIYIYLSIFIYYILYIICMYGVETWGPCSWRILSLTYRLFGSARRSLKGTSGLRLHCGLQQQQLADLWWRTSAECFQSFPKWFKGRHLRVFEQCSGAAHIFVQVAYKHMWYMIYVFAQGLLSCLTSTFAEFFEPYN